MNKTYRRVFVVEPSHDFSALVPLCEEIIFLTTGYENFTLVQDRIEEILRRDFNPATDAIVPVGRVTSCIVTGIVLGNLTDQPIDIAAYSREDGYSFTAIIP